MAAKRSPRRKAPQVRERPAGRPYGPSAARTCFVDTAYFLARTNRADEYHGRAQALEAELERDAALLLTTHAVLLEVGSALAHRSSRRLAVGVLDAVLRHSTVRVVSLTTDLFDRGVRLFRERSDKDWSLTDCLSFIVMSDYAMTDALTSDQHFVQAGFRALLRG